MDVLGALIDAGHQMTRDREAGGKHVVEHFWRQAPQAAAGDRAHGDRVDWDHLWDVAKPVAGLVGGGEVRLPAGRQLGDLDRALELYVERRRRLALHDDGGARLEDRLLTVLRDVLELLGVEVLKQVQLFERLDHRGLPRAPLTIGQVLMYKADRHRALANPRSHA